MSVGVVPAGPRLEQRAREARREHRRLLLRRFGWGVAVLAPLVFLGWLLVASPWLRVERVVVQGESRLTVAQVLAAAQVPMGVPLARVDAGAIALRVGALGPVASVSVHRGWPHTLRITLVERVPVVAVGSGRTWSLYDGTGTRLGTEPSPGALALLEVAHPGPHDPSTAAALQVLRGLPRTLRALVVAVQAASPEQVTLVLRDGRTVLWGGSGDGAAKAAALSALLALPGHTYDVSSPSVVTRR